jgi:hypothetical protein
MDPAASSASGDPCQIRFMPARSLATQLLDRSSVRSLAWRKGRPLASVSGADQGWSFGPWQAWGFSFRPDQFHVRSSCGPGAPAIDGDDDHRPRRRLRLVVRVLRDQSGHPRSTLSRPNRHEPRPPVHSDPPQCGPVLLIVVDEQAHPRVRLDVRQPPQRPRRLRLRVHGGPDRVPHHSKDNRHEVRATARRHRGEPSHPPRREPLTRPLLHGPNGMPGARTSHRGRWASARRPPGPPGPGSRRPRGRDPHSR